MIIRRLELRNFLSHANTEIDFDRGVTVIYGRNGAGKSSIIDAIKFALFGEKRGASVADLVKRGAEDMSVALEFAIGPHEYRIVRMMSLGKSGVKSRDAILTMDKSELARTVSSVDETVAGTVGIDRDIFVNSVFVEQGEIDALVSINKAEREKTFSRVLGLMMLGQFATDLRDLSKDSEARLQAFSGVSENMDQIRADISAKENHLAELRSDMEKVRAEMEGLSRDLAAAEEERNRIQGQLADMRSTAANLENRRKALSQIEVRIDRRTLDIKNLRAKFEGLSREIDSELLTKADAIGDYFSISDSLPAKKELLKDISERIGKVAEMKKEIESLEQGYRAYQALEKRVNDLRAMRPDAEKNETEYRSAEKRIREAEAELEAKRKTVESVTRSMMSQLGLQDITEEAIQKFRESLESERRGIEGRVQEIRSSIGRTNDDLKEIRANLDVLKGSSKCPLCLQPLNEEHMARLNSEYSVKEQELRNSQASLAEEKKGLDAQSAELDRKVALLNSPDVSSLLIDRRQVTSLEGEIARLKETLESLRKQHEEFMSSRDEILENERKMKNLRYSYDKYRSYEMTISSSNLEELEQRRSQAGMEIDEAEKKLQEMEAELQYRPEPNLREKIKEMRAKEKVRMDVSQSLFALTTTQSTETEQLEAIRKEIADLEGRVSALPEIESRYGDASAVRESANRKLQEQISRESSVKTLIETEEMAIEELRNGLSRLENDRKALEHLRESITTINKLRACFDRDGIQKAIRKDSAVYITNKVREYSSSFNLDFDDVRIDEDMSIEVSQNGSMESIDMLSGGEKVALAIALRLALATYVMESIKTIIMDEPTTYLDEDRRSNLKDIIQYTFKGEDTPVPQMIIVTHHRELGSVADNVFEVTKRNGSSEVTLN